jgi:hypothetical protein
VLLVMVKDDGRFKAAGGWGFEGFKGGDANQRAVADGAKLASAVTSRSRIRDSFSARCATDTTVM